MKSKSSKKATGVLLAAMALTAFGCGGGDKPAKDLVKTDGDGTQQVAATGGEGTGGTTTGEDSGAKGLSPALIMSIVNQNH